MTQAEKRHSERVANRVAERQVAKPAAKPIGKAGQALATYTVLVRGTESATSRIHKYLDELGLTISQFGVLEALYHLGPLCQKELASKILKTSGNLTMVIDNLEKSALVRRVKDEADGRVWNISLTDAGRKLIGRIFPKHASIVEKEMAVLSQAEQKTLAKLCKKLGKQGEE